MRVKNDKSLLKMGLFDEILPVFNFIGKIPLFGSIILTNSSKCVNSVSAVLNLISHGLEHFFYSNLFSKSFNDLVGEASSPLFGSLGHLWCVIQSIGIVIIKILNNELSFKSTLGFLFSIATIICINVSQFLRAEDASKRGLIAIIPIQVLYLAIFIRFIAQIFQMKSNTEEPTIFLLISELFSFFGGLHWINIFDETKFSYLSDLYMILNTLTLVSVIQIVFELNILVKNETTKNENIENIQKTQNKSVKDYSKDKNLVKNEIQLVYNKFNEVKLSEYKLILEGNGFKIEAKENDNLFLKFTAYFDNSAETIFSLFVNEDLRKLWDDSKAVKKRILRKIDKNIKCRSLITPSKFPVSAREFIFFETFDTKDSENYIFVSKSLPVTHELIKNKQKSTILGSLEQVIYFKRLDETKTKIEFFLTVNLSGNIPGWMISTVTQKALPFVYKKLTEAAKEVGNLKEIDFGIQENNKEEEIIQKEVHEEQDRSLLKALLNPKLFVGITCFTVAVFVVINQRKMNN